MLEIFILKEIQSLPCVCWRFLWSLLHLEGTGGWVVHCSCIRASPVDKLSSGF